MINLTITADNAADLHSQLRALLSGTVPTQELSAPLADAPKATRKKAELEQGATAVAESASRLSAADTKTDEQPKTEAGPAPAEAEASEGEITYDTHVKPAILDVSANYGGREAVLTLLSDFNVDHASKLTPDQWPALLEKVAKMKAAA